MSAPALIAIDESKLQPREVVAVEAEPRGSQIVFTCGHSVWFAIPVKTGDRFYCSRCFDETLTAIRAARDQANVEAGA